MTEQEEARRDGARLQKNSGRGKTEKGDAVLEPFCIDYKEYDEQVGVSRSMWAKITTDAWKSRLEPALKLVLGREGEPGRIRLWVVSDRMFHEMREAWMREQDSREMG